VVVKRGDGDKLQHAVGGSHQKVVPVWMFFLFEVDEKGLSVYFL
jgi:hypothetical protein